MPPTRSQLLQTTRNLISDYGRWNIDSILERCSPDCIHHTLPASMNAPPRSNAEYRDFFNQFLSHYTNMRLELVDDEILVDVEARKTVYHLRCNADSPVGPYSNEFIFTLKISEDGEWVDEVVEFIDSLTTMEYVKKFMSASS